MAIAAMGYVSLTDFRANLARHLDKLEQDRQGLEETHYLRKNPSNARFLKDSIADLNAGREVEVDAETMAPVR